MLATTRNTQSLLRTRWSLIKLVRAVLDLFALPLPRILAIEGCRNAIIAGSVLALILIGAFQVLPVMHHRAAARKRRKSAGFPPVFNGSGAGFACHSCIQLHAHGAFRPTHCRGVRSAQHPA
jgi:hypothetical protein